MFIREMSCPESEFVRKDTLDAHMKRIETLISLNMAEQKAMNERLEGKVKVLEERLDHAVDTLTVAINRNDVRMDGFEKRLDDMKHSQKIWFTLLSILVAVVPIAVALIQSSIAK
ncbi:MAG: hypothetical protein IJU98_11695 [Synergistaceae bacterium]|nr:hypothetical protein [Synergistaceae bacterium]